MRKAIIITGVIWSVICLVTAIVFLAMGAFTAGNIDAIANEAVKTDPSITLAVAKQAAELLGITLISFGVYFIVALVYSIVLMILSGKSIRKGAGIFLGILGIVLGAELPAIFFLIHAGKEL